MNIAPVSSATAFPTACRLVKELGTLVDEAGQFIANPALTEGLKTLHTFCEGPHLGVEVCLASPPDTQTLLSVLRWIAAPLASTEGITEQLAPLPTQLRCQHEGWDVTVSLFSWDHPLRYKVGAVRPAILFIVSDAAALQDEQVGSALTGLCQERPYVALIHQAHGSPSPDALAGWQRAAWKCESFSLAELPAGGCCQYLSSPPLHGAVDIFRATALVKAVGSLSDLLRLLMEQEGTSLKLKRATAQQRANKIQQQGGGGNPSEVSTKLREKLQTQFTEFDQGLQSELKKLFDTRHGQLWHLVEDRLTTLSTLNKKERMKGLETSIPPLFLNELLEQVRHEVERRCTVNLEAVRDFYHLVAADVEAALKETGAPPFVLQHTYLLASDITQMLEHRVQLDRVYRGQLPNPSPMDFFLGMRRYQMVFMMAVMPLLPLLVLTDTDTQRMWRIMFGILSVGLVMVGLVMSIRRVPQERAEAEQQELDKAREILSNELKRIFSVLQQDWSQRLSHHLKEEVNRAVSQLENAVRAYSQQAAQESAEEKKRIQRQLQSVEAMERQLVSLLRSKDTWDRSVGQLQGELRQLFVGLSRPAQRPGRQP
jgi:hypothetical protein